MSQINRLLDPLTTERLNHLTIGARRVVEGNAAGLHRSAFKGASVEFRQHRPYVPGDEPRRLDWRVLGRTDRLYVREYDEETNLRCLLTIDRSGSMGYGRRFGSKLKYSARLAAGLAYLMLRRTESVGLAAIAHDIDTWIPPRSHGRQLAHVIDALESLVPAADAPPASTLAAVGDPGAAARPAPSPPAIASHARPLRSIGDRLDRRSLLIIVSDLFWPIPELRQGLARLRHDRHEIILMQVIDPDELIFPFKTMTQFRGMEGERGVVIEPAATRQTYLRRMQRHQKELTLLSRSMQAELFTCRTDRPPIDALIEIIRQRST